MNHPEPQPQQTPVEKTSPQTCDSDSLAEHQHPDLNDAAKQEQYRLEYLRQLRLRSCPGCGEDGIV